MQMLILYNGLKKILISINCVGWDKPDMLVFMNQLSTKWMPLYIGLYQVSLNTRAFFFFLSWLQTHFSHSNKIHERCTDWDIMTKINTLMVSFCFEMRSYYKWAPDKQTHAWLPPDVLRGLQSLDRNNATGIIKGNNKSSACHVPSPYPLAWKSCCKRGGQNIHIHGFDMELFEPLQGHKSTLS